MEIKSCSCGNTMLAEVHEYETRNCERLTSGICGLVCPLDGHYFEFNKDTGAWAEYFFEKETRTWRRI